MHVGVIFGREYYTKLCPRSPDAVVLDLPCWFTTIHFCVILLVEVVFVLGYAVLRLFDTRTVFVWSDGFWFQKSDERMERCILSL